MTLVLDRGWSAGPTRRPAGRGLEVDGRRHPELVDLDRVKIVDASDADVERLVIRCGNDPDRERRDRYRSLPVELGPAVRLGPNAEALLERTFGALSRSR